MSHDADRNPKLTQKHMTFTAWQSPIIMIKRAFEKLRSRTISIVASKTVWNNITLHCHNHPMHAVQISKPMWLASMDTERSEKTSRLNDNTQDWLIIAKNSEDTLIDKMWRIEKMPNEITQQLPLNRWRQQRTCWYEWSTTLIDKISTHPHQTLIGWNTNSHNAPHIAHHMRRSFVFLRTLFLQKFNRRFTGHLR